MSFHLYNASTGKTIDIIKNRQLNFLIKLMFPNANIIIDKFHIVQLISRS